jgi:hypothetical protein
MKIQNLSIICLLCVSVFLISGCIEKESEVIKEKAMITVLTSDWGVNEVNANEIIIQLNVINYGYAEAKNVVITCDFYDWGTDYIEREIKLQSTVENVGNIASTSNVFKELYMDVSFSTLDDDTYYSPFCYSTACDDCELLDNRIPDFAEAMNA